MKVDDTYKSQSKEVDCPKENKKFKLKFKDNGFEKANKNCLVNSNGKFIAYPQSYREITKSPNFKKYIINDDDESMLRKKVEK